MATRYFRVTTRMQGRDRGILAVEDGIVVEWVPVPDLIGDTTIRDLALGKTIAIATANLRSYGVTEMKDPPPD